ncbi:hypothetical protein [Bartonella refiksaydamii]|uniref:hypothetical protein n=1 Tax=Bartonella refiksaydamii TaxID=2654951 RepID=UPI0012EB95A9|nr:hypothetical protein [Bartonella refiksaydamii]
MPRIIGVVTSSTGAVMCDIIHWIFRTLSVASFGLSYTFSGGKEWLQGSCYF